MPVRLTGKEIQDPEGPGRGFEPGQSFQRSRYRFQGRITTDGSSGYLAEPGRYHLYIAWGCPWAQRTAIVRKLMGLEDVISLSYVDDERDGRGWAFRERRGPDPVNGFRFLAEAYEATGRRFLFGAGTTEADVRLWPTLARFDLSYNPLGKISERRLTSYPSLWGYARDLYQHPAFGGRRPTSARSGGSPRGPSPASSTMHPGGLLVFYAGALHLGISRRRSENEGNQHLG